MLALMPSKLRRLLRFLDSCSRPCAQHRLSHHILTACTTQLECLWATPNSYADASASSLGRPRMTCRHQVEGMSLELVRNTDSRGVTMSSLPTKHYRTFLGDRTGTNEWVSTNGALSAKHARERFENEEFNVYSGPLFASKIATPLCFFSYSGG